MGNCCTFSAIPHVGLHRYSLIVRRWIFRSIQASQLWIVSSYRLKPAGLFILALPQNEAKTLGCSAGLTLRELEKPTIAKLALRSRFSRQLLRLPGSRCCLWQHQRSDSSDCLTVFAASTPLPSLRPVFINWLEEGRWRGLVEQGWKIREKANTVWARCTWA